MAEQPLNEHEQRFFLAEILKTSPVAPNELLRFIQEREIQPRWTAMALPTGRSIDSCVASFNQMLGYSRAPIAGPGQHYEFHGGPVHSPLLPKRPSVGQAQGQGQRGTGNQLIQAQSSAPSALKYGQPPTGDHPLKARPSAPDPSMHPQFSHFAAVKEPPSTPSAYQAGQDASGYGSDKKGKKRGRPSKAENEIRAAQALARGEPWPPVRKTKNPRTSVEGATASGEGMDAPLAKKKAAQKPKAETAPEEAGESGQAPTAQMASTMSAEEAVSPEDEPHGSDRMQIDPVEGPVKSTIPETQTSEFPAAESLLAGMQEEAKRSAQIAGPDDDTTAPKIALTETETVQSSITLQPDATPQTEQPQSALS